ncbi:hypothetical protein IAT38_003695 [Cryptococcus sp. DSM 104549]
MPSLFKADSGPTSTAPQLSRKKRLFWSYAPDWVLTIVLWGCFYLLDKINGYRRLFDITDSSLAHPYANPERVPVWLAGVLCGVVPAVIIIVVAAFHKRSFWDGHSAILGLVLSLGLVITFTNIIKITAGRPRPDLFARCILPADLTTNPVHGLTSWTVCTTTDDKMLQEGFRSFPSGHSSFAWCGMWYLILYLAAKMRLSNQKGFTWKSWLLLAPISCASLIAVSRTMDYRHHSTDVLAGSGIGVLGAWYGYRQYYPPLSHPQAHKPYSPRIPRDESPSIPLHSRHHASNNGAARLSTEGMLRSGHHHPSMSTDYTDGSGGSGEGTGAVVVPAGDGGYGGGVARPGQTYNGNGNPSAGRGWKAADTLREDDHGEREETLPREGGRS